MSRGAEWASSIASAIIGAVVGFMLEHFAGSAAVELLKEFFLRSWFVWLGLGVGTVVWALISVWRVTHGRDDEFTRWLDARSEQFSERIDLLTSNAQREFEKKYAELAREVREVVDHNARTLDGIQRQIGEINRQLGDHQRRLSALGPGGES